MIKLSQEQAYKRHAPCKKKHETHIGALDQIRTDTAMILSHLPPAVGLQVHSTICFLPRMECMLLPMVRRKVGFHLP